MFESSSKHENSQKQPSSVQQGQSDKAENHGKESINQVENKPLPNSSARLTAQLKNIDNTSFQSRMTTQLKNRDDMSFQSRMTAQLSKDNTNGPQSKATEQQQGAPTGKTIQKTEYNQEQEKKPLQRKESSGMTGSSDLQVSSGGLPDNLQSGIENLSGMDMSDVNVHHNSDKPAQLNAHAYAQGKDIHLAPGQDKHLPHEAWHIAQQKQGRVAPTTQLKGVGINDDDTLEKEADVMGQKALKNTGSSAIQPAKPGSNASVETPVQGKFYYYKAGYKKHSSKDTAMSKKTFDSIDKVLRGNKVSSRVTPAKNSFYELYKNNSKTSFHGWLKKHQVALKRDNIYGAIFSIGMSDPNYTNVFSDLKKVAPKKKKKRKFNPDPSEIMGKWDQGYHDSNPFKTNETQKFGVEFEIKNTVINYEPHQGGKDKYKGRPFYTAAVKQGHTAVYIHKFLPVELHLDSQEVGKSALLEVVTKPLGINDLASVMDWLQNTLHAIKSTEDYRKWVQLEFDINPKVNDYKAVDAHIKKSLKKGTKLKFTSAQVTTTHTAEEMSNLDNFPSFMSDSGGGDTRKGVFKKLTKFNLQAAEDKDDFIINNYLGGMKQYRNRYDEDSGGGKGSLAMVKHAAQQFGQYTGKDTIKTNPDLVRMDPYQGTDYELLKLRTRANKPGPTFKRNKQLAYLVEYRGSAGRLAPDGKLGDWITGQNKNQNSMTTDKMHDILKNAIPSNIDKEDLNMIIYGNKEGKEDMKLKRNLKKQPTFEKYKEDISIAPNLQQDIVKAIKEGASKGKPNKKAKKQPSKKDNNVKTIKHKTKEYKVGNATIMGNNCFIHSMVQAVGLSGAYVGIIDRFLREAHIRPGGNMIATHEDEMYSVIAAVQQLKGKTYKVFIHTDNNEPMQVGNGASSLHIYHSHQHYEPMSLIK